MAMSIEYKQNHVKTERVVEIMHSTDQMKMEFCSNILILFVFI